MAEITLPPLLEFPAESFAAQAASLSALSMALGDGAVDSVLSQLPALFENDGRGGFVLRDDLRDLVRVKPIDSGTGGANQIEGLQILPGNRYLELVTAIAGDGETYGIGWVHGWPVLSLGAATPSVTEAGRESIAPGGGLN